MTRASIRRYLGGMAVVLALFCIGARHDDWVEVRSPNFVVISNAGEKQARKTALQFEEIRQVFRQSLKVASGHPSPLITVIAAKDENTMKQLLPEDYVKGHARHAGYFVGGMNIYFAVVELGDGTEDYETFYHEYYHSLTVPYFPNLPLWVAEGLAEFYGHTQIDGKSVGMGQADSNLVAELQREPLIPLNVLFKIDRSSPYYNENQKTSIFYAESWALTHYLMLGDRSAHRAAFATYLTALDQGKSQDEAAAESFGDLKKLQSNLSNYLRSAAFYYMKMPFTAEISDSDLKARPISEAEAEAYEGGFEAIRRHPDDAKRLLDEALAADSKLPQVYEFMAISDYIGGDHAGALAAVSKAVDLDPDNSLTRYLRAELTAMTDGFMAAPAQVEEDLRKSINLDRNFAPPYGLLAVYMSAHDENLPEALSFAQKAVSFEPANATYQLALAQVLARMDKFDDARMAALRAQAWSRQPQEKSEATQFLAYLREAKEYRGGIVQPAAVPANSPANASANFGVTNDAQGTVANDTCAAGVTTFDLQTDGGIVHLRGTRGGFVIVVNGGTQPNINPCELNGTQIEVQYSPDDGKIDGGVIRVLQLTAPGQGLTASSGAQISEGKVASVVCKGNEMRLTLILNSGKSVLLHSADYTKLRYLAGANSSLGDIEPCSELKGRAAKISYAVTSGKPFAGEMQTIVVGK
ncbi:MAG: DUF1570 domain-containing protein [Candidatus Acidiferrales bacterium]